MKHISEILPQVFAGIIADHQPHPFNIDEIRKEKACLIEDIFRVMKASCPMNSIYVDIIGKDAVKSFDELYDMSISELELLLAHMSAELSYYMKEQQQAAIRRKYIGSVGLNHRRNKFRDLGDDLE